MKERPILFSAPLVRAILAGEKTQTRRIVKPQPDVLHWQYLQAMSPKNGLARFRVVGPDWPDSADDDIYCPYGQPGDRLWVRETFMVEPHPADIGITREMIPRTWDAAVAAAGTIHYAADLGADIRADGRNWRPSIHMPRAASRITLEITSLRVERLRDITEADVVAEGVSTPGPFAVHHFRDVWSAINGAGSWDANPWVWVVKFKRVQP